MLVVSSSYHRNIFRLLEVGKTLSKYLYYLKILLYHILNFLFFNVLNLTVKYC